MSKKLFHTSKGMTLIEVLATLALISVIGLTIYSVLFGSLKTYDRIIDENELRDEGDYIMANLISEFFVLKSSEITERKLPQSGTNHYYLVNKAGKKIGIYNSEITINDQPISLTNDDIILTNESKIVEASPGIFNITLVLKHKKSNKELKLSSSLSIINDRQED